MAAREGLVRFTMAKDVLSRHKPQAWKWLTDPNAHVRYKKAMESIQDAESKQKLQEYQRHAEENMVRFKERAKPAPKRVSVVSHNNLVAAQMKASERGQVPVVSFNSSPTWFGGAFFEGKGDAAEEAVFYSSTAPSLVKPLLRSGLIHLDERSGLYRYTPEGKRYLIGAKPMNQQQRNALETLTGESQPLATQVLLGTKPLVYTRTPLVRYRADDLYDDPEAVKTGYITDLPGSYLLLKPEDMTQFRPLFMAATNLSDDLLGLPPREGETKASAQLPVDWQDETFLKAWEADTRRRIAAELDTYLADQYAQQHHDREQAPLILGASGTGEYRNDPDRVAQIYAEEIEKRSPYLSDVSFAILTGQGFGARSHDAFHRVLDGMPLGTSPVKTFVMPGVGNPKPKSDDERLQEEATPPTSLDEKKPASDAWHTDCHARFHQPAAKEQEESPKNPQEAPEKGWCSIM